MSEPGDGTTKMHAAMVSLASKARTLDRLQRELLTDIAAAQAAREVDPCYDPLGLAQAHLEGEPQALAYLTLPIKRARKRRKSD